MSERANPVCVVGAGYVGLVTAGCLADPLVDLGFTYIGVGRPTRKPRTAKAPQSGGKRAPALLAVK